MNCKYGLQFVTLLTGVGSVATFIIDEPLHGVTLSGSFLLSILAMYLHKELIVTRSISKSVDMFRNENEKLKNHIGELELHNETMKDRICDMEKINSDLEKNNEKLEKISTSMEEDLDTLKHTVGILGESGGDILMQLRGVHKKLKDQNDRHSVLIKRQMCLHVIQLVQHLDKNSDFVLDQNELEGSRRYINAIVPDLDVNELEKSMVDGRLDLVEFVDRVKNMN